MPSPVVSSASGGMAESDRFELVRPGMVAGQGPGDAYDERGPAAPDAADREASGEHADQLPDDRQAQAVARGGRRTGATEERLEDPREVLARDSGPGVGDLELDLAPVVAAGPS